jgi:hypothetical protein
MKKKCENGAKRARRGHKKAPQKMQGFFSANF